MSNHQKEDPWLDYIPINIWRPTDEGEPSEPSDQQYFRFPMFGWAFQLTVRISPTAKLGQSIFRAYGRN